MPSTPTKLMSSALKSVLVPELNAAGFAGSFPDFRRDRADVIHFVSVQYDKPGTAFFLECGAHPPGEKTTSWGDVVAQADLRLAYVPLTERARLQGRGGAGGSSQTEDWFSYEGFGDSPEPYRLLAASVASMLPQIESWLTARERGPNLSTMAA